jgi:ABC-type nitrate/sulfonate/bicarbonate transport system substrate-binding protein
MGFGRHRRWLRLLAAVFALALLAAGCGDDDGDAADDTTTTAAGPDDTGDDDTTGDDAAPELSEIRIGLIPIADVAPVFLGIEEGYFEDEGLTVRTEFAQGGAAAIPALVSGDIDFAFGAYPSFFSAVEQGLTLLIASEANRAAPMFAGLYSMPDSGIESIDDLAGTTIAVNTFDNIVQIAVEAQLATAGLTLDDVTLVEIPFPNMVATLETGDVDVIAVVEPFGTIARNTLDATLVTDMFAGDLEGFPVAGFYVTEAFAAANPNTVAAFNRAFARAVEHANTVDDAVPQILPTYIETATVEGSRELNYPLFVAGIDTTVLQAVPDFMANSGLLDAPLDTAEHVVGN